VPIITAVGAIVLGVVLSFLWPPVQRGIDVFSTGPPWAAPAPRPRSMASWSACCCLSACTTSGTCPFFFEMGSFKDAAGKVVHGDINRFFAGDRTAGILAGAFLFKMFGLPGAALAIWRSAKPENRKRVGGIMISAALTSFLTGITEPIEFSFMFVAPGLYLVHAVLAASTQFVSNTLGMHMGFTFSQGGIDFRDVQRPGPPGAAMVAGPGAGPGLWPGLLLHLPLVDPVLPPQDPGPGRRSGGSGGGCSRQGE
jgi:PTS system glucose-specific IIC component